MKYVDSQNTKDKNISSSQIGELMETVRFRFGWNILRKKIWLTFLFRWLSLDQIKQIFNDKRIPRNILIEALMIKMREIEDPENVCKIKKEIPKNSRDYHVRDFHVILLICNLGANIFSCLPHFLFNINLECAEE